MAAVLHKAFRDSRRTALWLALGFALYAEFIVAFYPSLVKQSASYDQVLESFPKGMLDMFYGGDAGAFSITDPGVYVQIEAMAWLLLILGAVVIVQAFNAITNAERDGTMDLLLSYPISRRQMLVGRALNTALLTLIVLAATALAFWAASYLWPEFDVQAVRLWLAILGAFLPLMVVAGFTYLLASVVPSSRRFAGPLAYLFLMGGYLIYSLSAMITQLKPIKPLFIYDYYNAGEVIRAGVPWGDWAVLAAAALLLFAAAWYLVDRKEMGV